MSFSQALAKVKLKVVVDGAKSVKLLRQICYFRTSDCLLIEDIEDMSSHQVTLPLSFFKKRQLDTENWNL